MKPGPSVDELVNPDFSVPLKGKRYRVQPVDGFGFQMLERMDEGSEERSVEMMYKIAHRCVPNSLPWEEFFGNETTLGVSPETVGLIIQIARKQVELVAETAKNGSAATTGKGASKTRNKAQSSPDSRQSIQ